MPDTVIRVENLGKKYTIGRQQGERYTALRDVIADGVKGVTGRFRSGKGKKQDSTSEDFWALKDVSFEIKQGDRVGIIGRNGAGKSTLLKILSRITEPTEGRIKIRGRVASLLEVGTGFHPELTGRENIYLNGAILGMGKVEIRQKFDEIVAFAEVEKFLDTPVKRYSSGMYVRLAFAVAAHLEPEILIVDEVLAVGDVQFQKKCLGKMEDVAEREGRTVIFVTHNMAAAQSLCEKGVFLKSGRLISVGSVQDVICNYSSSLESSNVSAMIDRKIDISQKTAWFTGIKICNVRGEGVDTFFCGETIEIIVDYRSMKELKKPEFYIGIYTLFGEKIVHIGTPYSGPDINYLEKNGRIICRIPKLPLPEGKYKLNLALFNSGQQLDHISEAVELEVQSGDFYGTGRFSRALDNKFFFEHEWYTNNT